MERDRSLKQSNDQGRDTHHGRVTEHTICRAEGAMLREVFLGERKEKKKEEKEEEKKRDRKRERPWNGSLIPHALHHVW